MSDLEFDSDEAEREIINTSSYKRSPPKPMPICYNEEFLPAVKKQHMEKERKPRQVKPTASQPLKLNVVPPKSNVVPPKSNVVPPKSNAVPLKSNVVPSKPKQDAHKQAAKLAALPPHPAPKPHRSHYLQRAAPHIDVGAQTVDGLGLEAILNELHQELRGKENPSLDIQDVLSNFSKIHKALIKIDEAPPMALATAAPLGLADIAHDYREDDLDVKLPELIGRHKALGEKGLTFYRDMILGNVFAKIKNDKGDTQVVNETIKRHLIDYGLGKSNGSVSKYSIIHQILTISPRMRYANGSFSKALSTTINITRWTVMTNESPRLCAYFTMPKQ